ncbi:MAG: hypothetical protein HY304_07545, partial [candidate division Zixibacteria bacterium]|nr:hypothetical protein [candidate division Zixibacteria bacterium]
AAIVLAAGMVFAACEDGGFISSANLGLSWDPVFVDQPAHALLVVQTTPSAWRIYVGTDIGIIRYVLPAGGLPQSPDTLAIGSFQDNLSQRVVRMGLQPAPCSTFFLPADTALWALCRARSGVSGTDGFAVTGDSGATWAVSTRRLPINDVAFNGCQFFLATDSGLAVGNLRNISDMAFVSTYDNLVTGGRVKREVRSVATQMGRDFNGADSMIALWAGSDSGLALTFDAGARWGVVFANSDPHEFDLIQRFISRGIDTATSNFLQLSGNFVTTLALQQTGGARVIWAATQATGQGRATTITTPFKEKNGVSVSRDGGQSWSVPLVGHEVWNFAFDGPTVWAASSQGLLHSPDGIHWDTLTNFVDPLTKATIDLSVEIFAVEVVGNEVWIGTENGFAILNKDGKVQSIKRTFQPVDPATPGTEGGAYANPVPYSPSLTAGGLRLHYKPPVSGPVTITIYDFANHVVKVLLDRVSRDAGRQYDETDLWDGRNGGGDIVAVGTYFFVIEYANGAVHWGKIPVIR